MTQQCSHCGLFHHASSPCLRGLLPQTSAEPYLTPSTLLAGRYRILRRISSGGASTVYEATDALAPQRRIALKELRTQPDADRAEADAWFARESALLSQLRHPRIPAFYSVFQEEGRSYIALEYIDGVTLDNLAREQGPLPEHQVATWGVALCELLSYLHGHQDGAVIYRDLKPSNMLLRSHDGVLMVVDFGIAKRYQPHAAGTVIGTPGYAAPEQYQGLASPQSDLYALGATMHRLLTGFDPEQAPPFSFPPVRQLNRTVSAALADLVERLLALDPASRPASAAEVRLELEQLARAAAPPLWSSKVSRRALGHLFGALAATLVVAAGAVGLTAHSATIRTVPSLKGVSVYTTPGGVPVGITPGPGGSMWYMNERGTTGTGTIGRVAGSGLGPSYPLDTRPFGIQNITAGPDHTLWIIGGDAANRIERLDTDGRLLGTLPIPGRTNCYTVLGGADGTIWLTCNGAQGTHYLEQVPRRGAPTSHVLSGAGDVNDIAFGPRSSVWVTQGDQAGGRLWRVSADGAAKAYTLPSYDFPFTVTAGRDGSMWFTICTTSEGGALMLKGIGRIDPHGRMITYPTRLDVVPSLEGPSIKAGSDGNIWFTAPGYALLGRITPTGKITYFSLPSVASDGSLIGYDAPDALMGDPRGSLWVLLAGSPRMLRFDPQVQ